MASSDQGQGANGIVSRIWTGGQEEGKMSKSIVLTGGGTAGHVYPALALAEKLGADGYDVHFAGTPHGIESRIVPDAGHHFESFESSGFDRSHPASLISGISKILKSTKKAKRWFKEITPSAVVSFGGYVSIPVARAAEKSGIPVIVHEQNSVMGMANKYISKKARMVCLTYEEAVEYVPEGVSYTITGNPVRQALVSTTREEGRKYLGLPDDVCVCVVFGGSGGARHINQAIAGMKDDLLAQDNLCVIHITGNKEFDSVVEDLSLTDDEAKSWRVIAYEDEMPKVLSAADVVVSRAGATSLAEISAKCIPAVLIPYPYATNDHQRINARSYASSGAAMVIDDADLDTDDFRAAVLSIVGDEALREEMREAARSLGQTDAASALAKAVEENL